MTQERMAAPTRIKTISDYHRVLGYPEPEHPLVSLIVQEDFQPNPEYAAIQIVFDFYLIALKRKSGGEVKFRYGQSHYDFDEGTLFFLAPGQVFSFEAGGNYSLTGWMLLIHPDFLWNTALSKMNAYEFFGYSVHEALWLSKKEETTISGLIDNIRTEYSSNIDRFSQTIIVSQIETLLSYADRFYHRQFLTRKKENHRVLVAMEQVIDGYFDTGQPATAGPLTVGVIAQRLSLSENYLSTLLKTLTGKSTLDHIHDKLIEKAKQKLSSTALSVSEIAYELGFDYPQSFGNLFKKKTSLSPTEFRQSFQ